MNKPKNRNFPSSGWLTTVYWTNKTGIREQKVYRYYSADGRMESIKVSDEQVSMVNEALKARKTIAEILMLLGQQDLAIAS